MVCGRSDPAAHQHIPMAVAFFGDEDLAKAMSAHVATQISEEPPKARRWQRNIPGTLVALTKIAL